MADVLYAGLTYEQVVYKYNQTVASVCVMHVSTLADAEDCFQNTFLKLYTKSPEFTDENHLKAWLIRVAINECNNSRRRYRWTTPLEEAKNTSVTFTEDIQDISWAFLKLEPKYRDVLYLKYCEQYKSDEIAEILGKKPSTVRTMLKRGVAKLKSIYGGDDL